MGKLFERQRFTGAQTVVTVRRELVLLLDVAAQSQDRRQGTGGQLVRGNQIPSVRPRTDHPQVRCDILISETSLLHYTTFSINVNLQKRVHSVRENNCFVTSYRKNSYRPIDIVIIITD